MLLQHLDNGIINSYLWERATFIYKITSVMELIQIRAECFSGYMDDQTPKCFKWQGTKYEVREVIDRWYRWDSEQKNPKFDYFMVVASDGEQYILKHDLERNRWYLCLPGDEECDAGKSA